MNEKPKVMPIESVIDVSRLESDVRKLSEELQALLNTAQQTTGKRAAVQKLVKELAKAFNF